MVQKLWFKKKSPLHGSGLFAKTNIKKGQKVIQYIGDKVTKREGDKRADKQIRKAKKDKNNGMVYVFELNKRYDIDGDVCLLYTSPSPRDLSTSRMPSSA